MGRIFNGTCGVYLTNTRSGLLRRSEGRNVVGRKVSEADKEETETKDEWSECGNGNGNG
jgi:hypothetical protein